jgi:hypothetical protein
MIDTILDHSGDFKSHFKSKIRHIFERLIRKFGYETIDGYFPDQHKKLIANIKKRRESLKKRKQAGNDHREQTQTQEKPKKFEEAFQDSDSDLDSDNDDYIPEQFKEETRKQKTKPLAVIREGEVVDFLDKNIVSQITHEQKQRKAVQTKFKNKDGKMVFEDQIDEEMVEEGEDYYKQSLENEMAFTRGPDGRVKFLKRKRDDDQEETVGKRWNQNPKNKREKQNIDTDQMLGRQYKAKNAKGDVKRAGMAAPHAYIPLSGKIVGNMYF